MGEKRFLVYQIQHDNGPGGHTYTADSWCESSVEEAKEKCQSFYFIPDDFDFSSDISFEIFDRIDEIDICHTDPFKYEKELNWIEG